MFVTFYPRIWCWLNIVYKGEYEGPILDIYCSAVFVLLAGVPHGCHLEAAGLGHLPDQVHDQGQEGEGGRKQGVSIEELDDEVYPSILPLCVEVCQDLVVGDGEHDDEYPEEHHAHQELVHHPHGHHGSLEKLRAWSVSYDAGVKILLRHGAVGHLEEHAGHVVHGLHPALGDGLDVYLIVCRSEACQAVCVVGEVSYSVIVGITTEWLNRIL